MSPEKILHVFAKYFRRKYECIAVDEECIAAKVGVASRVPEQLMKSYWKGQSKWKKSGTRCE